MQKIRIIILTGTSSAGKSSIAKELQKILPECYLHFQMDTFWNMVPEHIDASSKRFSNMKPAMVESAISLLKHGHNLIFDTVTMGGHVNALRDSFSDFSPFITGVRASLEKTEVREKERGDRKIGMAASQYEEIHRGVIYDIEIDTTNRTAAESAEIILQAYLEKSDPRHK